MPYIICYDITSNKTRKIIHDTLITQGEKVNLSVFELDLKECKLNSLIIKLNLLINPKTDTIKIYKIPTKTYLNTITIGTNPISTNYI
ncbi:CRISPR-associated endonuclease Cas2 [Campylobacter canadensis]|uniref:CRISPR-associated endonuclease Cas2 n=1 Tax=Campylobacter canadensis TaxID=449520 RepID=UPI0015534565|nr:CRISPR-associated endonuclease Cas2 [Campylobacter canadensis]